MSTLNDLALRYLGEYDEDISDENYAELLSQATSPPVQQNLVGPSRRSMGRSPEEIRRLLDMDKAEYRERNILAEQEGQMYENLGTAMEPYFPEQAPYQPIPAPVRGAGQIINRLGQAAQTVSEIPGVVEDVTATIGSGIIGSAVGGVTVASQVINDATNYLLSGATDVKKAPPDYWKNIFKRYDEISSAWTIKPRTKAGEQIVSKIGDVIRYIPGKIKEAAIAAGVDEDKAILLERVSEFALMASLPLGLKLSGGLRRKVSAYKSASKSGGTHSSKARSAAEDLASDPEFAEAWRNYKDMTDRLDYAMKHPNEPYPPSAEDLARGYPLRRLPPGPDDTSTPPTGPSSGPTTPPPTSPSGLSGGVGEPVSPAPAPSITRPIPPEPTTPPTTPTTTGPSGIALDLPTGSIPPSTGPSGIALDLPPPPAMVPADVPRPPRTPPGSMGVEAALPDTSPRITSLSSARPIVDTGTAFRRSAEFQPIIEEARRYNSIEAIRDRVLHPETSSSPGDDIRQLKIAVQAYGGTPGTALRTFGFTPSQIKTILPKLRSTRIIKTGREEPPETGPSGLPVEPTPPPVTPPITPTISPSTTTPTTISTSEETVRPLTPALIRDATSILRRKTLTGEFTPQQRYELNAELRRRLNLNEVEGEAVINELISRNLISGAHTPITEPETTPSTPVGYTDLIVTPEAAMDNPLYASVNRMLYNDPTTTVGEVASELGLSLGEAGQLHSAVMRNMQEASVSETPFKKPARKKAGTTSSRRKREVAPPNQLYHEAPGLKNLEDVLTRGRFSGQLTDPRQGDSPIKVGYQGRKPTGVYIDTTGLGAIESAADIDAQFASGSLTRDQAMRKMAALSLKARVAGVPIDQAHDIITEDLPTNAIKLAQSKGLDVYVRRGDEYVKLPASVVEIEARDIAPTPDPPETTPEQAQEYFDTNQAEAEFVVESMQAALEAGIDISESLPAKVAPQFKRMLDEGKRGISNSYRSKFIEILKDINELFTPDPDTLHGIIGGLALSPRQKAAARRLYAHLQRGGDSANNLIRRAIAAGRLKPEDAPVIKSFFDSIKQPPPPRGLHPGPNPGDMTFRGSNRDPIVAVHSHGGRNHPPIHLSEAQMVQDAPVRRWGVSRWTNPQYGFERYGLTSIVHRYRENERFYRRTVKDIETDMKNYRKEYTWKERVNVVANRYARTPEGRSLNAANGMTPEPMTLHEQQLDNVIDAMMKSVFDLLQETRSVTGREPMHHVADYLTHIRTFSVLEQLGLSDITLKGSATDISKVFRDHSTTPFPFAKMRKGGQYRADYDLFNILERYLKAAYRDIAISPITSKINELVNREMPDLRTGGVWIMTEKNPPMARFLQRWSDGVIGVAPTLMDHIIDDPQIQVIGRKVLRILTHNVAASVMAYNFASALRQLGGMSNTYHALGEKYTVLGVTDLLTPGKHRFANDTSNILDTRSLAELDLGFTAAIATRNPIEIAKAIRDFGFVGHTALDKLVAEITWLGAYRMATDQGLKGKAARNFADNTLVKTQGSTMPGELAAIQRNDFGQSMTSLQTYPISNWNYLIHEIIGKSKSIKGGIGLIRWLGSIGIAYYLYEKIANISSPLPSPKPEGGDDLMDYAWELAGLAPFGGGLQFGRTPVPPLIQAGFEAVGVHNPSTRTQILGGAKVLGVPLSFVESIYNSIDPFAREGSLYPFYRTLKPRGGPQRAGKAGSARRPRPAY